MKILCFFSGSLRHDLNTYIYYISEFKKNFNKNIEIKYLFITNGNNQSEYCNYEYYKKELSNYADVLFIEENAELKKIKTINGCSTISLMYYKLIQEYITTNNLYFNYIIKCRNDIYIKINNINKYFNNNTYVTPRYWYNTNPNSLSNDHFFIIPFIKFMLIDFSNTNIDKMSKLYYDTEILTENMILPDKIIDIEDVSEYLLNGSLKFHIKNNKFIISNFPTYQSIANK